MREGKREGDNSGNNIPRDAATVILVRESSPCPFEIFMMRRHSNQAFMGGAYVFPGGRLDDDDCDPELVFCGSGLTAHAAKEILQEKETSETTALGLFFTAVRETFEEAGVLLACDEGASPVDFAKPELAQRLARERIDLHEQKISMKELAERERIRYKLDALLPYSHWITPDIESRRFDTRFFLARLPKGQIPVHDSVELTESLWISAAKALEKHQRREIILMPPTLKTIEELHSFSGIEALFDAAKSKIISTILPQPFRTEDCVGVKLPHDSEYTLEKYRQTPRAGETSRIVLHKGGTWETASV